MEDDKLCRTTNAVRGRPSGGCLTACVRVFLAIVAILMACGARSKITTALRDQHRGLSGTATAGLDRHDDPEEIRAGEPVHVCHDVEYGQKLRRLFASKNRGLFGASVVAPPTIKSEDSTSFI